MAGYIDGYAADETRRSRIRNRILLAALAILVVGGGLYFTFRDYGEKQQIDLFVKYLRNKQYKEAYELWGCTDSHPCRDYKFERFMEDWGPGSKHADPSAIKLGRERSCSDGIIQTVDFNNDQVLLWVNRSDRTIGFAPWPMCNPRMPSP